MNNQYDAIYEKIASEIETGKTKKGLWTRLFAECNGDEQKTKVLYIKQRAEKLISDECARLKNATHESTAEVERIEKLHPSLTNSHQMEEYDITFDGERYAYRQYKYDRLSDAINYAKLQNKVASTSQKKHEASSKNDQTIQEYEAVLGEKNKIYYQTKFENFDKRGPGLKASWNWPAFFAGGVWALYRKMYGWFFALWGTYLIGLLFKKANLPSLSFLFYLVPWVAFAVFANSLYQRNLQKKISVARTTIQDEQKVIAYLHYKGGVNTWVVWVFVVFIPICAIGILAAILIPMFAGK